MQLPKPLAGGLRAGKSAGEGDEAAIMPELRASWK
jgi:hypothetical protein